MSEPPTGMPQDPWATTLFELLWSRSVAAPPGSSALSAEQSDHWQPCKVSAGLATPMRARKAKGAST
eukprot:6487504-Amphidinium_carterae.1